METFFGNGYDVVLAIWGVAWIVGGAVLVYMVHRVIRSESESVAALEGVSSKEEKAKASPKELVATGR
jgi:threonine/homoserine/homoserine lactone efflux protein